EEVAQLLAVIAPAALHRVEHLVGLLDEVGLEGREGLLPIPGAAAGGAQPRHDAEEPIDLRRAPPPGLLQRPLLSFHFHLRAVRAGAGRRRGPDPAPT